MIFSCHYKCTAYEGKRLGPFASPGEDYARVWILAENFELLYPTSSQAVLQSCDKTEMCHMYSVNGPANTYCMPRGVDNLTVYLNMLNTVIAGCIRINSIKP